MSSTAAQTQITATSKRRPCRFYLKGACRAGDACPYKHDASSQPAQQHEAQAQRSYQAPAVTNLKVVAKPQPKPEDRRAFEIGQIARRFKPEVKTSPDCDVFMFSTVPSDPEFPFDLEALACELSVPAGYPSHPPHLRVVSKDIPRGFQINIERGFATIYQSRPEATLLGMMNQLDKKLESILSGEMAETMTIKISANRSKEPARQTPTPKPQAAAPPAPHSRPKYTIEEKQQAHSQRQTATRQLEARFGRLPAFQRSSDGSRYTMPLDSPKKSAWPASLQALRVFTLLVPELYPLEPAAVILDAESVEARNIEEAFAAMTAGSLTQMINTMTINLKDLAQTANTVKTPPLPPKESPAPLEASSTADQAPSAAKPNADKPHVIVIARPPEWDAHSDDSSDSESESDSDTQTTASEEEDQIVYASAPLERGILISFPNLELHGIELMEVSSLSITIKCDRCKETMDIERLQKVEKHESCRKCANSLSITFRADLMHSSSVRAGYLDLDGCTVVDMLPSTFIPTCAECSVAHPAVTSVRGDSAFASCRECHKKMTFRIIEVKFLQLSIANTKARPTRRKPRENLGISAGTELPRRGRCAHYAKSYRWFRFSCCNKVYACDRCHDEAEEHLNEHANRMLCGYCSREQNYRPEDCAVCHAVLIGRRGRGFWEGGKGTRDKARMSKKDPRKYKRIGGSAKKT